MSNETEMMIRGFAPIERPETRTIEKASPAGEASFSGELGKALQSVDKMQVEADEQSRMVAEGGGNLHEVALSLEKADVAMRLAMKVRNKLVDAYNEIMRMSV